MNLSRDSREFIELLNSRGVDYLIVGAHSLAFHGRPRYTGDLDILIRPTIDNAARLIAVLKRFGFGNAGFKESDLIEPAQVLQLGRPPNRIDLLTGLSGITVDEAFADRLAADIDGLHVFVLSRENLIRNKRAVARPRDLADIAELER
jgi:predicted nucleotidyltransferase